MEQTAGGGSGRPSGRWTAWAQISGRMAGNGEATDTNFNCMFNFSRSVRETLLRVRPIYHIRFFFAKQNHPKGLVLSGSHCISDTILFIIKN